MALGLMVNGRVVDGIPLHLPCCMGLRARRKLGSTAASGQADDAAGLARDATVRRVPRDRGALWARAGRAPESSIRSVAPTLSSPPPGLCGDLL